MVTLIPAVPPTLADVAREASVSKTTASDALRGHGRVSEPTRRAVVAAAERLGYAPNRSARSLRTAVTETVALHVPEFPAGAEYSMAFVFGVVEQAARAGLNVTLLTPGHLPHRGAVPQVDGLVLCDPVAGDPVVERLMDSGLPVVTAERHPGGRQPSGVVRSDHETSTTALLDHLRASGARRPAFLASDRSLPLQAAYVRWAERHGLPKTVGTARSGATPDALRASVRAMLAETPGIDAVVCAADGAAVAVLPELRAAGRGVGEDLLLASCVDSSALRTAEPPITAVDPRPRALGAACGRLLCEILSGDTPHGTVRTLPADLHVRASTRAVTPAAPPP